MTKTRICFLATTFVDYSAQLAEYAGDGSPMLVIADEAKAAEGPTRKVLDRLAGRGDRIITMSQRRIWNRALFVVGALTWLVRFRPTVVIAHEHLHPHVAILLRLTSLLTRLLLIVHDPAPHTGRDADFAKRNTWCGAWERRAAWAFLVHGAHCNKQLRTLLRDDPRRILSIPLAPQVSPDAPFPLQAGRRILVFGRMEAYKGLSVALDAARLLRSRGFEFEMRIVGSGPELDLLQEDLRFAGCTVINRFVTAEEALEQFRWSSVVLAPYLEATQSGIVALSFACGRPVVATAVGGLPDFVADGENGCLVGAAVPALVAEALESTLSDPPLLIRLAEGAARSGTSIQSWSHVGSIVRTHVQAIAQEH